MNKTRILFFLIAIILPLYSTAQQDSSNVNTTQTGSTKIGLALSGGGAKGFAHIGVLKVFEKEGIPIHRISGTSMGAIIGSLYAIGYTPKEIEDIALSTNWNILFNDNFRINPQNIATSVSNNNTYLVTFPFDGRKLSLPAGLIDGRNISMMLYRLMLPYHDVQDFTKLPIPFSAVATNLANGDAHTFTSGYLPDAVRASIAIPTIFKPVEIDSSTYIDGGVARNIPVEDVQALGADIVITSDVGEPVKPVDSLQTFVDVLFQSVGFHQQESDMQQKKKTDFYLRPNIKKFSSFSYEKAQSIIEQGEKAARQAVPKIKEYLSNYRLAPYQFKRISSQAGDSLFISDISFSNIEGLLKKQTQLAFGLEAPATLALSDIEQKVNGLYESGFYNQISYRLQNQTSGGDKLVLEFRKKEQDFAGFSIRYDSQYKAALLFGATFSSNIIWNDRLDLKLRAGEVLEAETTYQIPLTLAPVSEFKLEIDFQRSPINFFSQNQVLSTINVENLTFRPSASVHLISNTDLEVGLEAEFYNLNQAVGNTLVLGNTNFLLNPFLKLSYNTLNRPYFPTKGQSLYFKSVVSDQSWGSIANFIQASGQWRGTLRLFNNLNFTNTLFAGFSSTNNLPLHYNYYLGGLAQNPVFLLRQQPFLGHETQQLRTSNVLSWQSDLQYQLTNNIYLSGGFDIAHLADTWTFNFTDERLEYGFGVSVGATTIIGPIELSLSTPNLSDSYALKIDVGYNF